MSVARNENGQKVKLFPDSDNWEGLQTLLDASSHLTLPPGVWPISKTLVVKSNGQAVQGHGVERTTLRQYGDFPGPVLGIGQHGTWNPGGIRPTGVVVRGLTLLQTGNAGGQNCLSWNGDDALCEHVRVRGSAYEGLSAGSNNMTFRNIEAWDCGNGGPAYPLATAGLNIFATNSVVDGFRTLRCGQAVETGHTRMVWRNGHISSQGSGEPHNGINIGSTATGIYDVLVENVTISDYWTLIAAGPNGIGRMAKIVIRNCKLHGGEVGRAIEFSGGKPDNVVTGGDNPYEGPDTEGSEISGNEFYFRHPTDGAVIYNSGPNEPSGVYAREPLTIYNNDVYYELDDPSDQFGASFAFGGKITAACRVENNRIHGMPVAPPRGDMNAVSITGNPMVPGFPALSYFGNVAYGASGERPLSVFIEVP